MAEEREYSVSGRLCDDKNQLEEGEVFLRFPNWRVFKRLFWNWLEMAQALDVTVKALRYKRSLAQNRWMWGICVPSVRAWLLDTTGEKKDKDEVYLWLNTKILGNKIEVKTILGDEVFIMTGKRFSQMTTKEFSDAVEKIVQHFDLIGWTIPLPKDNNLLDDHITDT